MANIIAALFGVALVIGGALTLTGASFSSASEISSSWDRKARRTGDRARTELTLLTADFGGGGADIDISLRNSGQTALASYPKWDVVIQYYENPNNQGMRITRLQHTEAPQPANGQWTVTGIYLDAASLEAEVYEPNVFNPGEEMVIRINITPAIPANTDNLVTTGADNGITLAAPFSR